jgi:small subunit ribosomal protein S1
VPALQEGDLASGTVESIQPWGAFIDLGGVTGLLHISQISQARLKRVDEVFSVGDSIKVLVLKDDPGRISLSTRKMERRSGEMLFNKQAVWEGAEEMAAALRRKHMLDA